MPVAYNRALKVAIVAAGFSQRTFSNSTGISEQRISDFIVGARVPSPEQRQRIVDALGVSPSAIFPSSPADAEAVDQPVGASCA
jgi:transcriptional regulator with XRE-family HTH domain